MGLVIGIHLVHLLQGATAVWAYCLTGWAGAAVSALIWGTIEVALRAMEEEKAKK